jgi:NADPH-dependent 2,4-dienoyl-CoA reductase/sulfur reductase-like enzyme
VLCFVVLAEHLGIGLRTAVYAVGLATSGTVSWVLALCMLAWAAVAQYVAHLVAEDRPRPAST